MRQRVFGAIPSRTCTIIVGVFTLGSMGLSQLAGAQGRVTSFQTDQEQTKPASSPLDRRVSVTLRDVPLGDALAEVDKQAELGLVYSPRLLPLDRKVSIAMQNATVAVVLKELLQKTGVVAKLSPAGRVILAAEQTDGPQQQGGILSGRVVDSATNEGLPGVTVTIRGTTMNAVTDPKGGFLLRNVAEGERTVEFKLLGYVSLTRTVNLTAGKPTVLQNIRMRPSATVLSGVVTTATGERNRREVGNSVVTLNVDSLMQVAPISSVTDLLETRVPGMIIQRTSGSPGDPARIRLRGTSSISLNNDPIIIVDGIRMYSETSEDRNLNAGISGNYATPSPLDQIDPNSIERIEILKGPSAAALYGSDAANGVIIITKKRGQVGPAQWRLSGDYGMSYMPNKWPTTWFKFVSGTSGGVSSLCWGFCGDVTVDSLVQFQALNDSRSTALGTGSLMAGSVSVNGGSQNANYNLTVSTSNEMGILKMPAFDQEKYLFYQGRSSPQWMKRPDRLEMQSGSVSVGLTLSKNTTVKITTGLTRQIQRRTSMTQQLDGAISQLQEKYVDFSVFRPEPLLGNPYERVISGTLNMVNGLSLNVKPFAWLPIISTAGFNTKITENEARIGRDLLPGELSQGAWNGQTNNATELTGTVTTTIPITSRLDLRMGSQFNRGTTNDQEGGFRGFVDGVSDPAEGTIMEETHFRRSTSERNSVGWFVEPLLNIRSRLFVLPGFRLDNNGLSGSNAGFNGLPKMNFSWITSDEPFFPFKGVINLLQLRGAFGVAGVQPKPGQGSRLYRLETYNPYNSVSSEYGEVLLLSHVGNASLRPERGVELEGGFVTELWDGRLMFDFTHAQTRRKDAIISTQFAPSANGGGSGFYGGVGRFGELTVNLGDIRNTNTEISASAKLIERRAMSLSLSMNMTRRRSKILRLRQDGTGIIGSGDLRYEVGYPMEAVWMRPIIGFADADNDGMISRYEVSLGDSAVYVGSTEPSFQLNGSQNLTFLNGRLSLNANWSYKDGALQTRGWSGASRGNLRINAPGVDLGSMAGWVMGEDSGVYRDGGGSQIGRMMVVDLLRLEEFSMRYSLGPVFVRMLRVRSASLAVQGRNLGIWTNYAGVDPNVNAYSTGNQTLDAGTLPQPRTWRLSLSLGW